MSSIRKIRDKVKNNKNLTTYNDDEIRFVQTTVGKALYQDKNTEDEVMLSDEEMDIDKAPPKAKWNDRVECNICGKIFTRSCRTAHNGTLYHRMKKQEHEKLKKILIDN